MKHHYYGLPYADRLIGAAEPGFPVARPPRGAYNLCDVCTLQHCVPLNEMPS
jgi:hypothetical protein